MNLFRSVRGFIQDRRAVVRARYAQAAELNHRLMQIVRHQAQDRWLTKAAADFTPETIETTIRGAMAGNLVAVWELYDLMEGTWYRLQKNLNDLKRAVVSLEWPLQAWAEEGDEPSDEAERRRKLLSNGVWSMRPNPAKDENEFEDTIWHLLDAWAKGITVLEIDWEQRPVTIDGRSESAIMPRDTRWIHPRYYGYPHDRDELMLNGREIAAAQSGSGMIGAGQDWLPFTDDKFLIAVCKQKAGHSTTSSLLRPLGFWWAVSNFSGEWMLNFAQLFGQPIRWATYDPARKDLLTTICEMLENMGSSGWAAMPAGTQLELKEAAKSGQDNPQAWLLQFADKVCDLLVVGQTLTSEVGDSGSRALGEVHQNVRADIIDAAGNWVAKILNYQFVPAFCRLNFGNTDQCPWLAPSRKQAKDAKAMAERDKILSELGMKFSVQYLHERHDVPVPEDDEELIEPPSNSPSAPGSGLSTQAVHAKDATDQLIDTVLEDLSGVQARWLGGVKPFFARLIEAAEDENLSDEEFVRTLEGARKQFPELFDKVDKAALAKALENAMGAAVVNGALKGALRRRKSQ